MDWRCPLIKVLKMVLISTLLCCTMTGCNIGADAFGTGMTGVFGGEKVTEPQSNPDGYRFDVYNTKKVEEAPAEEKVAYDFTGPENKGITKTESSVIKKGNGKSEVVKNNTIVLLSSGHSSAGQNAELEFSSKFGTYYFAMEMAAFVNNQGAEVTVKDAVGSGVFSAGSSWPDKGKMFSELYKAVTGKTYNETKEETVVLFNKLCKYGILKKSGSTYTALADSLQPTLKVAIKFEASNGTKVDKLLAILNEKVIHAKSTYPNLYKYLANRTGANESPSNKKFLKMKNTSGSAYESFPEYKAAYECMKGIGSYLKSKGYTVKYTRSNKTATSLTDGTVFSNKNMSVFAEEINPIVHIVVHWDENAGSKKGPHTYTVKSSMSKTASDSKKCADAMYSDSLYAAENTVSDNYTTLNWGEVPTVIYECGWLTTKDYGSIYDTNEKTREKNAVKWGKKVGPGIVKGIKAIEN